MALVTKEFKLDLAPGQLRPVVNASQGDIGRPFKADLYWNGSPWTATGYTAKLRGKKPDNTVFEYTATVSGSSVTFSTTEQMTIISGQVECELVFSNSGDVIASANFLLIVEDSPYNPDALSESEVTSLADVVTDVLEENPALVPTANLAAAVGPYVEDWLDDNGAVVKTQSVAGFGHYDEQRAGVFVRGSWDTSGTFNNSDTRARSIALPSEIYAVSCTSEYSFFVFFWTNGTYTGYLHTNGTVSTNTSNIKWGTTADISGLRGSYPSSDIRLLVKNSSNTTFSAELLTDAFTFSYIDTVSKSTLEGATEDINEDITAINSTFQPVELSNILEQGFLNQSGTESTSTTRVRTKSIGVPFGNPEGVYITFAEGFKYIVYFFNSGRTLGGVSQNIDHDMWLHGAGTFRLTDIIENAVTVNNAVKENFVNMRFVIAYEDNAEITPADAAGAVTVTNKFPALFKVYESAVKQLTPLLIPAHIDTTAPIYGKIKFNGASVIGNTQICYTNSGTHYTNEWGNTSKVTLNGEYYFCLKPEIVGDCNFLLVLEHIQTAAGTFELWLSNNCGFDYAFKNRTGGEVVVASKNYFGRYFNNVDYFCDGVNDEVEIQAAIDQVSSWGYGTVKLLGGAFNIDSFTEHENADRPAALFINGGTSINIEGTSSENSTVLNVTAAALAMQEDFDEQCDVFGINQRSQNTLIVNYKNLKVVIADQEHPVIVINNYYAGASKLESVRLYCNGYGPGKMPVEGLIGVRCSRGNPNGIGQEMRHVGATGFYEGFQMGGEHLVAIECLGRNCYYSYTFGNYPLGSGVMEHPLTLINCCDELSAALPLFNMNGAATDPNNSGRQQVDLIGFNMELRSNENPTLADVIPAEEVHPGTFCGRIEFVANKFSYSMENALRVDFWKDGSGQRFRTTNMAHRPGGPTSERSLYIPQYMQTYFDTDLNKMLVYDGTQWRDMNGTAV